MEPIHFVLRDEIVNVHAMTTGGLKNAYGHQVLLCKNTPNNNVNSPFLLDTNKNKSSKYKLSTFGDGYYRKISSKSIPLSYVGYIDLQIKIKVNEQVFIDLADSNFFSLWLPESPLKYFKNNETGYLMILKVSKINKTISRDLLSKSGCRHYYYGIDEDQYFESAIPVIPDDQFDKIKHDLMSLLKNKGYFIEFYVPKNKSAE